MLTNRSLRSIALILVVGGALSLALPRVAGAQQSPGPRLLITWRAFTYAPAYFSGKLLPTGNSLVRASVELIDHNRFASLSGQKIYWYLNDEFLEGGSGKQTVFFRTPSRPGSSIDVRVHLPDYAGGVIQTIQIPSVQPEAVIEAPAPLGRVTDQSLRVFARPFFFNVEKLNALSISWIAGGKRPDDATNPETLDVNLEKFTLSAPLSLGLTIANPGKLFETAKKDITLRIER